MNFIEKNLIIVVNVIMRYNKKNIFILNIFFYYSILFLLF